MDIDLVTLQRPPSNLAVWLIKFRNTRAPAILFWFCLFLTRPWRRNGFCSWMNPLQAGSGRSCTSHTRPLPPWSAASRHFLVEKGSVRSLVITIFKHWHGCVEVSPSSQNHWDTHHLGWISTLFKVLNRHKKGPWSSRWFEEISVALIFLALIWLALIWLALIWLTLIWLALI